MLLRLLLLRLLLLRLLNSSLFCFIWVVLCGYPFKFYAMICNKIIPIDKPYQYTNRCNFIGGIVSGIGSVAGSLFSANAQKQANRTQIQIARENNQANENLAYLQNTFNVENWNRENEYNSASNQRARLEAAGLNPYLMMSGGSSGTASSVPGAGLAQSNNMPNIQSPSYDFSGLGNGIMAYENQKMQQGLVDAQKRKLNADAAGSEIQNTWLNTKLQAEIENLKQNTSSSQTRQELDKFGLIHSRSLWAGELAAQSLQNSSLAESIVNQRANTLYTQMQTSLADMNLKWLPKTYESQISLYAAQQYAAVEAGYLSRKNADLAVQNKLESAARTQGQKISNFQSRYITSKLSYDAATSKFEYEQARNTRPYTGTVASGYSRFMNTVLSPLKGILSGGVTKSFK